MIKNINYLLGILLIALSGMLMLSCNNEEDQSELYYYKFTGISTNLVDKDGNSLRAVSYKNMPMPT
ncbi:MAG: hypothetical protein K2I89_11365, partial [Muribaculaceae bacterium]|nr:hypothetical protein [Muribaculaceae bacterium]